MTLVVGILCAAIAAILGYIAIAGRVHRWLRARDAQLPEYDQLGNARGFIASVWPVTSLGYAVYTLVRRPIVFAWRGFKRSPPKIDRLPKATATKKGGR